MKIEQTPSGSYRIRQMYKGKRYTITVPYKPTQKEALQLMAAKMEGVEDSKGGASFDSYAEQYIEYCKAQNKSPATIKGYNCIRRAISEDFKNLRFFDITRADIQQEVSDYAESHSPKTVRNVYGFMRAIFAKYRPDFTVTIKLPSKQKKAIYEPSTRDVQRILEYAKGTRYYMFLRFACIGLRRGEIACLSGNDIKGNMLTINKDMVLNDDNEYVIKNCPKTEASNRRIMIPDDLAKMLKEQGYVFNGNIHTINEYLHKVQDKLDIPQFRLHILRHFAAAYLLKNGFSSQQVEEYMGWERGSEVMKRVYAYNLDAEESQKKIVSAFDSLH